MSTVRPRTVATVDRVGPREHNVLQYKETHQYHRRPNGGKHTIRTFLFIDVLPRCGQGSAGYRMASLIPSRLRATTLVDG